MRAPEAATLLLLTGCVELPDMPEAAERPDWACDTDFKDLVEDCIATDCDGFMSMDALGEQLPMPFASTDVTAELWRDTDGTLQGISLSAVADYFRGSLELDGLGMAPGVEQQVYGITTPSDAHLRSGSASIIWSITNSDDPFTVIGDRGVMQVSRSGPGYEAYWVVFSPGEIPIRGCAYFLED